MCGRYSEHVKRMRGWAQVLAACDTDQGPRWVLFSDIDDSNSSGQGFELLAGAFSLPWSG